MEFVFLLHKAASGVRLSFSAATLVNVGNYENVRREVSMQVDVDERGLSAEERESTVREVFESLHGCVTSMLGAAVGEAVPEDHELASPARHAAYVARRAREREEREERDKQEMQRRRDQKSAEKEYEQITDNCDACKVMVASHAYDPETGAKLRYCTMHAEGWALLMQRASELDSDF